MSTDPRAAAASRIAPPPDGRLRLALVSQVANGKPIHMLRVGTFVDSAGREFTFTADHLRSIVANYPRRPNPPITERHDWGRAYGRTVQVWTDDAGENLYGLPMWNAEGQRLLAEGVYDGYSCELDSDGAGGFIKIGGSLTNYPAVGGLQAVTLAAPEIDAPGAAPAPEPAPPAAPVTEEEIPMSDAPEQVAAPTPAPAAPPAEPAALSAEARAEIRRELEREKETERQLYRAALEAERAAIRAEFQREMELERVQLQVAQFCQHATTATLTRSYALPTKPDRLSRFLLSLSAPQRAEATAIFQHILDAGLVSFEEIGAEGAGGDEKSATQQYEELVAQHVALGMKKSEALAKVAREFPAVVAAYNAERAGRK